jgi:iron complex transport system substrate-binding protein
MPACLPRRRTAWAGVLVGAALAVGAAGCGPVLASARAAHPLTLVDDLGRRIRLRAPARRLVVIEPSNFEIVAALGLRHDIVGIDTSIPTYTPPPWNALTRGLPSVGPSYPAVSAERIAARRPQLVIAPTGVAGLGGLNALHIPVLILNPQSIAGVYHDIELVGRATGTTARAIAVVRRMSAQVAALSRLARRARTRPLVFYDLGGLYTAGPHTFINSLIDLAGAENLGARLAKTAWPQVSAEQVVAGNPSVILVDPDATTVAKERAIPGFLSTRAGRTGHIEALPNSSYVNEPSPGLVEGLRELIQILHPGLLSARHTA